MCKWQIGKNLKQAIASITDRTCFSKCTPCIEMNAIDTLNIFCFSQNLILKYIFTIFKLKRCAQAIIVCPCIKIKTFGKYKLSRSNSNMVCSNKHMRAVTDNSLWLLKQSNSRAYVTLTASTQYIHIQVKHSCQLVFL